MVFRVLQMPKISDTIAFHLPIGACMLQREAIAPLALPWYHPCIILLSGFRHLTFRVLLPMGVVVY